MKHYLEKLITEKGTSLHSEITHLEHPTYGAVIGLTWNDLIEFVSGMNEYHDTIRKTLVKIDFMNGDIFHYLRHLANGMVKATL